MQKINIDETALYKLIKRAVRDGLQEQVFRLRLEGLPFVSEKEMQDIEKSYGKPRTRKAMARRTRHRPAGYAAVASRHYTPCLRTGHPCEGE